MEEVFRRVSSSRLTSPFSEIISAVQSTLESVIVSCPFGRGTNLMEMDQRGNCVPQIPLMLSSTLYPHLFRFVIVKVCIFHHLRFRPDGTGGEEVTRIRERIESINEDLIYNLIQRRLLISGEITVRVRVRD